MKNTRGANESHFSVTSLARAACNLWRDVLHRDRRSPSLTTTTGNISDPRLPSSRLNRSSSRSGSTTATQRPKRTARTWVDGGDGGVRFAGARINNPTVTRGRNVRDMKHRNTEVVQVSRPREGGILQRHDSLINELSNAVAFQRLPMTTGQNRMAPDRRTLLETDECKRMRAR